MTSFEVADSFGKIHIVRANEYQRDQSTVTFYATIAALRVAVAEFESPVAIIRFEETKPEEMK